jgi:hypothetical protein
MAKKGKVKEEPMNCMYCSFSTDDFGKMAAHMKAEHPPAGAAQPAPQETAPPSNAPPNAPQGPQGQGGVRAPEKKKYLNFKALGTFSYNLEAIIKTVSFNANGQFGPSYELTLDNGYTYSLKQDSQNHFDMYARYGTNWTGKRIKLSPGTTERGSARIAVTPLT